MRAWCLSDPICKWGDHRTCRIWCQRMTGVTVACHGRPTSASGLQLVPAMATAVRAGAPGQHAITALPRQPAALLSALVNSCILRAPSQKTGSAHSFQSGLSHEARSWSYRRCALSMSDSSRNHLSWGHWGVRPRRACGWGWSRDGGCKAGPASPWLWTQSAIHTRACTHHHTDM